ncbi:MAG: DUF4347 domain-containing protein, partial [Methylococcales bacterium]|nr:DUF4347 domain-containing protein [Methylococcales bacterium]
MRSKKNKFDSKFIFEEMEPRQLFSGGIEALITTELEPTLATYVNIDSNIPTTEENTSDSIVEQQTNEIVFVDTGVENHQTLVDDILNNADSSRKIDVILLDSNQNGIEKISDILLEHDELDAIHIISHGSDGNIQLGNTSLNAESVIENSLAITLWAESFGETGDILIYGCNLAETGVGKNLINSIGHLTQTDVAASDDLTGQLQLGGDWELEYETGSIEINIAISASGQTDYESVLATYTVTNTFDLGFGSLRQAILNANLLPSPDIINFDIGADGSHQTITVLSQLPTITQPVTIDGLSQYGALAPGAPRIELNQSPLLILSTDGLKITGNDTTVKELIISGFNNNGISIENGHNNNIQGNYIGTDYFGLSPHGNLNNGISIYNNSSGNIIGGTGADQGNLISGNIGRGIVIQGTAAFNQVIGNKIGTDTSGLLDLGNKESGILITANATNNTIGGSVVGSANIISGNDTNGIKIQSDNNTVIGNYIGTNLAGISAIPNSYSGISIHDFATGNTIGGTTAAERNIISGNGYYGIELSGGAFDNTISGNYIGIDITGNIGLGNTFSGINIYSGANTNTIGGTTPGAGNVISANNSSGITIDANNGTTTDNNLVQGNYIGTNALGLSVLGNAGHGVLIFRGGDNNTIGGTAIGAGNLISGNIVYGISIGGNTTNSNTVKGNYIGTDINGIADLGNFLGGVLLHLGTHHNQIGGNTAAARNIISGNNSAGVSIGDASNNKVQGNYIGTDINGTSAVGNTAFAVKMDNVATNNMIGGINAGEGNLIAFSDKGISITGGTSDGNAILRNSIHTNSSMGLDLDNDGVSLNDLNDVDASANNNQNFPILTSAVTTGAQITITGSFNSTANNYFRIEFFSNSIGDASGHGEGEIYLGFEEVLTDGSGNANINSTFNTAVPHGSVISATATKSEITYLTYTNTSEFALNILAEIVNTAPQGADKTITTPEDTNYVFTALDFGFVDTTTPLNNLLNVIITSPPSNGTLYLDANGDNIINGGETLMANSVVSIANINSGRLKFLPALNANGLGYDSFTFQVQDDGGTANNGIDTDQSANTITIDVTAINDAPIAANASSAIFEDTTFAQLFLTGTDVDGTTTHFNLNTLPSNGTLYLDDGLTTTATTGVDYATGGMSLSLYFAPDANWSGSTSFTYLAKDNLGTYSTNSGTGSVLVHAVNDIPVISNFEPAASYTENSAPIVLVPTATIIDVDNHDFDGGTLTVGYVGTVSVLDITDIRHQGNAAGEIGVSGSDVSYGGTVIGTFAGTAPIVITFNANADQAAVEAVTRNITYSSSTHFFSNLHRVLRFTLTDGDGGTSDFVNQSVNIIDNNDAPLHIVPATQTVLEETQTIINGISLIDPDALNTDSFTTQLTVNNGIINVTLVGSANISAGANGSATLTMTGTLGEINTILGSIQYTGDSNIVGVAADTLTLFSNDKGNNSYMAPGGALTVTNTIQIDITNVNDVPVLASIEVAPTIYLENNLATVITSTITLTDPDDVIESATIQVTSNYQIGEDLLAFTNANGISGSWDSATGILSLSGSASVANYQAALRSITYINNDEAPSNAARTFSFTVDDGSAQSNIQTRDFNIIPVNDAATLTAISSNPTFTEDGVAQGLFSFVGISNTEDDQTIEQLIFTVINVTDGADEVINVDGTAVTLTDTNIGTTITNSYDYSVSLAGSTATITLTTTGMSRVNGQILGDGLSYQNNSDNPTTANRVVTITSIKDSGGIANGGSDTSSPNRQSTVTVIAINDAPVNTVPLAQSVNEDTLLAIAGISVNDVDNNLSTVQLSVANGLLNITPSGAASISAGANNSSTLTLSGTQVDINNTLATLTYQGNLNFNGIDTLTVLSTDTNTVTDSDTVTITVNAVNDAPVNTVPIAQSVNEDTLLTIAGISVNDVDNNLST